MVDLVSHNVQTRSYILKHVQRSSIEASELYNSSSIKAIQLELLAYTSRSTSQKSVTFWTMEEADSQFNLNCTNFTEAQLKAINLTRGIMAIVCVVIVGLILLFLLCHKAYSTSYLSKTLSLCHRCHSV